ncbi:MAG: amidase [Chloroflexi bacterium]|nr:amidase [Chloroflexota bacterium]
MSADTSAIRSSGDALPGLPATDDLGDLDLKAVSEAIGSRTLSSVEATEAYLRRIERHDGVLRAYITVTADLALEQARTADDEIGRGERRGPLHGVPLGIKDLIGVQGVRMTSGSRVLAEHVAGEDAHVTTRLREAGAVFLGKLAMHEWAFGRPTTDEPFPTGRNPWNVSRITAGSSSGSGAAAAGGLCAGALGSDTGGSVRGPSALCGLVGHKPTYGLVSRRGVLPMDWSLDHVGPMTRSVWDSAQLLQTIAGPDPGDASTSTARPANYIRDLEGGVRGMRLGLFRRYYLDWPGLHPDVRSAAIAAFAELERQGAHIEEVDAPTLDLAAAIWVAFLAEMYAYHVTTVREQPELYRDATRQRMLIGAFYSAADYLKAQQLRARLAREIAVLFERVDAFVFPGFGEPATAFPTDPTPTEVVVPGSQFTSPWNLVGLPACVVPSGFSQDGLPVAIQIVGKPFDDATVLRIARAYERATIWHTRRPDPAGWTLAAANA